MSKKEVKTTQQTNEDGKFIFELVEMLLQMEADNQRREQK